MGDQHISFCTAKAPAPHPLYALLSPSSSPHPLPSPLLQIGTMAEVEACKDANGNTHPSLPSCLPLIPPPPAGLRTFYYLVQDLKCFVLAAISVHFRVSFPAKIYQPWHFDAHHFHLTRDTQINPL